MVTLKEIAEICNVSAATVSNILNGKSKASAETTQHVLEVVEKMGYKPNLMAQGLRRQKTKTIALIVDDIAQFTSPPMVEGVMEYCEQKEYRVIMRNLRLYSKWHDTWYNQETLYHSMVDPVLQDVLSAQVDGVIYIAGHARIAHCFTDDFPVPAVMAYAFSDRKDVPSIVIEDAESACQVMREILAKGHKRVGIVGGRMDNFHTQQRLLGYQKALFEYGIPYDPSLVYYGDWTRETGCKGAEMLMQKGVTAIFCVSDKMAGGAYDYLLSHGYVIGKDVSVAGFDDEDIAAYFSPKLTTTRLPLAQIGQQAAKVLIEHLEGESSNAFEMDEPVVIKIPCTYMERDSIGEARKAE